jgi:sortase A
MTLAPPTEPETAVLEEVEPATPPPAQPDHDRVRPAALRAFAVAAVFALAVVFVEIPVAQTWYHARQHQLLTDFQTPHRGLPLGGAAALLQIQRLHATLVVVEGDAAAELRSGPGHHAGTPLPGRRGNSIILGHQSGWGGPFGDLGTLKRGNHLVTQLRGAKPVVYTITAVKHVSPSDRSLTGQSKDYRLTLITGDGGLLSNQRLVVQAVSGDRLDPHRLGPVVRVPDGSLIVNAAMGIAAAAFVSAAAAAWYLRRHYRIAALLAVTVPLVLAGLLALLIDLDQLLPPLR